MENVKILRQALPYIKKHRNKLFVVKSGGEIARDPAALARLAEDFSLLQHVGIKLVLVHGGGPQASELSEKLGWKPEIVAGRRVTDENTLDVAKMIFAGKINVEFCSALRRFGSRPVGLSGVDADILNARRRPLSTLTDPETGLERQVDFGHVGDIESVDPAVLHDLVDRGYIPVVSSLGSDSEGNVLNINADTVASAIAQSMQAAKLILMTNVPGILEDVKDPSSVISTLTLGQIEEELETGGIRGGMLPKVTACVEAVRGGVHRAHILNGLEPHVLLIEIFTRRGAGTMIVDRIEEDVYEREFRYFEGAGK